MFKMFPMMTSDCRSGCGRGYRSCFNVAIACYITINSSSRGNTACSLLILINDCVRLHCEIYAAIHNSTNTSSGSSVNIFLTERTSQYRFHTKIKYIQYIIIIIIIIIIIFGGYRLNRMHFFQYGF